MLSGCIGLFYVAHIGYLAAERAADRVTRNITEIAKVEQALGMTTPFLNKAGGENLYWQNEPIVATRHLQSRKKYKSSNKFVLENMKNKNNSFSRTVKFYNFSKTIGVVAGFWTTIQILKAAGY